MRDKSLLSLLVIVFCFCFQFTLAQAAEEKAQLYFFEDVVVKPSMVSVHEASIKEMAAHSSKHKYPYPWYAYSTDDFHYYYVFLVDNLAEIDNIFEKWDDLAKKVPEEQWQSMLKKYWSAYEYSKWGIFRYRANLSLVPEKSRLESEEAKFRYWGLCYVKPGMRIEFEDVFKKIKALYKSKNLKNIDYGWKLYMGDIGTDMPFYFFLHSGMSAADFWSEAEKRHEAMGQELFDLWWKAMKTTRKFESKTGWFRPELSYIPNKK